MDTPIETKLKDPPVDPEFILSKVDLSGKADWDPANQHEARNLICEYTSIFSHNDLDLGKTILVKHKIKLADPTPFKEQY